MNNEGQNQRPVATVDISQVINHNSLANQWPLYGIPKNRIAYKLYYHILSLSAIDHLTNQAYLSDKYWTKKAAAQVLGCDPRTINSNLTKLSELGILERDDTRKGYIVVTPKYFTHMDYEVIARMLSMDDTMDAISLIQIYSIIVFAVEHNCPQFTITDIKCALGKKDINGDFVRACIAWYQEVGLIRYTTAQINHGYSTYTLYNISKVNLSVTEDDFEGPNTEQFKAIFEISANSR